MAITWPGIHPAIRSRRFLYHLLSRQQEQKIHLHGAWCLQRQCTGSATQAVPSSSAFLTTTSLSLYIKSKVRYKSKPVLSVHSRRNHKRDSAFSTGEERAAQPWNLSLISNTAVSGNEIRPQGASCGGNSC